MSGVSRIQSLFESTTGGRPEPVRLLSDWTSGRPPGDLRHRREQGHHVLCVTVSSFPIRTVRVILGGFTKPVSATLSRFGTVQEDPVGSAIADVSPPVETDHEIMKLRTALAVHTVAIFLSAALLFSVQPLFARMVLPSLGGAPAVWNSCLFFFQGVLLAGYLYVTSPPGSWHHDDS